MNLAQKLREAQSKPFGSRTYTFKGADPKDQHVHKIEHDKDGKITHVSHYSLEHNKYSDQSYYHKGDHVDDYHKNMMRLGFKQEK